MYTTSLPPANKIVKPTLLKLAVKLNIHYNISNMGIVRSFDLEQFTDPTTSNVVVVSGPSGAGKGTLISAAQDDPELSFAWPVSSTTRGMRPGEAHGSEYDFVAVSYTHLRAHETVLDLVCRLLLEKKHHSHISQDCTSPVNTT